LLTNTTKVSVRYAETDQMGVVYHANYVVWCEIGRTKLIEDLGFKYADMEKRGVLSPVTNINLNYLYPAKYGEDVTVNTWIEQYNGLRVTYGYRIENSEGQLCVEGTSEHVCVDAETFRPVTIKKKFPDWHEAYEKNKK
jgi:acyl-CoA thioester hydrolase